MMVQVMQEVQEVLEEEEEKSPNIYRAEEYVYSYAAPQQLHIHISA